MRNRRFVIVCLLSILSTAAERSLPADPKPVKPTIVAELSLAPLDRIDPVVKRAGIDGYREKLLGLLESMNLSGKGSIDTSLPFAVYLVDGENVRQDLNLFAFPVKAGAAPLQRFLDEGFKPVPGLTDTVTAPNGYGLRRTKSFLIAGGVTEALALPTEELIVAPFKNPAAIAHANLDLKAIRATGPEKFQAFLDGISGEPRPTDLAMVVGIRLLTEVARALDRIDLSMNVTDETMAMRFIASPVSIKPAGAKYARPTFPEGCFARLDYVYPQTDSVVALSKAVASFSNFDAGKNAAVKDGKIKALYDAISSLLLGDAISIAAENIDGQIVAYVIVQSAQEKDLGGIVAELQRTITALAREGEKPMSTSTYEDNGQQVTRLTLIELDKPLGYLDLVKQGKTISATFSLTENKQLSRLLLLKPAGEISNLVTGEADIPRAYKALEAMGIFLPKDPFVPAEMLKSGKLAVDVSGDGRSLTAEFRMPLSFWGLALKTPPLQ